MVQVDVIIPVHNASDTIREAVHSAMSQTYPPDQGTKASSWTFEVIARHIEVTVCCYDDGSTDDSLDILKNLQNGYDAKPPDSVSGARLSSRLLVQTSKDGVARGAGYARNRAIEMNNSLQQSNIEYDSIKFLCLLDSDDTMHEHRVALQLQYMMNLDKDVRNKTLLGCNFARDPPDSTWHYSQWANSLSDERLLLERFREVTVLQPTWFMPLSVFRTVGGYVEAPLAIDSTTSILETGKRANNAANAAPALIHPRFDTASSLRLAEDLRFFHAHLQSGGVLRLLRSEVPLVTYRYFGDAQSQSFRTSRKLLLQLRALAFQRSILDKDPEWQQNGGKFIIWGAGRDGKDFFKALERRHQEKVLCFVDVDAKKLAAGQYVHRQEGNKKSLAALKIPIVHFSFLVADPHVRKELQQKWYNDEVTNNKLHGCIDKSKNDRKSVNKPTAKRQKTSPPQVQLLDRDLDHHLLQILPVVVCVALYRTNNVLEHNVSSIQRTEGKDLWHFS